MGVEFKVIIIDKKGKSPKGTIVELVGKNKLKPKKIVIGQKDKEFDTFVSIIPKGSIVSFLNYDPVKHHVYSVSKGNKFDLPLYSGTPPKKIVFNKEGVVKIGCNIHDWMLSYAYVSQSKYIATTKKDGKVYFPNIPKGKYQLRIWNPRFTNNKKVFTKSFTISKPATTKVKVSLRNKVRKPHRNMFTFDDSDY